MPAYAVLGAQWGDEGKGKIIDFLASKANIVARFSGGNNAGHTVINDLGHFSLHSIPCGIFRDDVMNVIGNGVVVNPDDLIEEMKIVRSSGVFLDGKLMISERSHLIMPYHVVLDNLAEKARGNSAIGTTGKGIGPAYSDKTSRTGIRAADLLDLRSLKSRLEDVIEYSNAVITKIYGGDPISLKNLYEKCQMWAETLGPYIGPTGKFINDSLDNGGNVVIEGAQGILLDLDHGTYPYVTSSNSTIGGVSTGLGIQPRHISSVLGIFKAYNTRVGSGPFPSELLDDTAEKIRTLANEFGTTTGRPRRVGWFDGVAAAYSTRINGYSSAVITRLDVLDGFEELKVCVAYELDGELIHELPGGTSALERCKPVYETLRGWHEPTAGVSNMEALPHAARGYLDRLEELVKCPISIVSTGPHRDQTIMPNPVI
jgi:adenylosuccinate synthase